MSTFYGFSVRWYRVRGVREIRGEEISAALRERFAARLRRSSSGCLLWTGARNGDGYGVVRMGSRLVLAHRLAFAIARGLAPADRVIDHRSDRCSSRACCENEHLRPLTIEENTPAIYGLDPDPDLAIIAAASSSSEVPF